MMKRIEDLIRDFAGEEASPASLAGCPVRLGRPNKVNIIALGDVGTTMLTGLILLGGDVISEIGIFDISENNTARLEIEMNQIRYPFTGSCSDGAAMNRMPKVKAVTESELFDCDMLVFCASKGVPPVGEGGDVRMAQLSANRELVKYYGKLAAAAECGTGFKGLIAVVSDPVDPLALCMDTSKAIGIIITNPEFEDVRSLEGVAPTKNPCVPIIAVPTTAGTAAEVTINYVITDVEKKRKFVCVDTHDMPIVAVVDPDMMASMPKGLTASTGMDALTHAIEGYTTKAAWEMTDMFHIEAIRLIAKHLRGAVAGTDEGREGMALAQYIAGMGFSNVGLGIDHSMAHTLSAYYDTPHGMACAQLLPISMAGLLDASLNYD